MDPVNSEALDQIEARLLAEAQAADAAAHGDEVAPEPATPETEPTPDEDAPKVEKPEGDADTPPTAPESAYTKARKDGERLDRSWKKLEEEKVEIARQRAELETARAPKAPAKDANASEGGLRDENGHAASDYRAAAKRFRDRGDDDLADEAEATAKSLEDKGAAVAAESQHTEFVGRWQDGVRKIVETETDLKNPDSPLAAKVKELLAAGPFFHVFEDGFSRAVETAKLHLKAARVDSLSAEVQRLTEENQTLREATSIDPGNPAPPPSGRKSITDLSDAEAEARLLAMAAEADAVT